MRQTNQAGRDLIKYFEGYKAKMYLDSAGLPTIGYGHLIRKGETFPNGVTSEDAEILLMKDLYNAEQAVISLTTVTLTDNQFAALVCFTYNVGRGNFANSTLRQKINKGLFSEVGAEFLKWNKVKGKEVKGLTRRREAEKTLFYKIG